MSALFLSPHNDDETLFGAFMIQRQNAHVVTVLRSFYQAERWPNENYGYERREDETKQALNALGVTGEQWGFDDRRPDWSSIRQRLELVEPGTAPIFAPFPEEVDGHEHHDELGRLAIDVFGRNRVLLYTTYSRENGRTVGERFDPTPREIARKLRALACYSSQHENPLCRAHFLRGLDEYLARP